MSSDWGVFSLAGKVVVVTGGTRRYGYHFCHGLAARENVFGYSPELGHEDSIE